MVQSRALKIPPETGLDWNPRPRAFRSATVHIFNPRPSRRNMPVNLPTTLLRSFVAIVDTGSMLNAAETVFVTQSALSLQIKRLEELVPAIPVRPRRPPAGADHGGGSAAGLCTARAGAA